MMMKHLFAVLVGGSLAVVGACSSELPSGSETPEGSAQPVAVESRADGDLDDASRSGADRAAVSRPRAVPQGEGSAEEPSTPVGAMNRKSAAADTAKAEPLVLEKREFTFDYDNARYTIPAPHDAVITEDQDRVEIHAGRRFNLRIEFGRRDLSATSRDYPRSYRATAVSETSDAVVLKEETVKDFHSMETATTYEFGTNITLGYRDFFISSLERDAEFTEIVIHSRADCLAMLEAARQLALAQPLPDDAAAVFELFDAHVGRDDSGKVVSLTLPAIGTTDATMPLIAELPSLTSLSCYRVQVKKESFAVVAQLPNLERLDLNTTPVDDSAVGYLSKMTSLRVLSIGGTQISQAGYEKLKAALGDCEIRR
jgi:hypothetical protein